MDFQVQGAQGGRSRPGRRLLSHPDSLRRRGPGRNQEGAIHLPYGVTDHVELHAAIHRQVELG